MKKNTTLEIVLMVTAFLLFMTSTLSHSSIKTHRLLQFGFYLAIGIAITLKTYRFFPMLSKAEFRKCLFSQFLIYLSAVGTLFSTGKRFLFLWLLGMILFSSVEKNLRKEAKII